MASARIEAPRNAPAKDFRPMPDFKVNAPYEPTGDQPAAITGLVDGISDGLKPPGAAGRDRHGQDVHRGQG